MHKTEGMLKKMTSRSKEKEGVSKKELEALLQLKVDKIEFESQLNSLSKGNKRSKKLAALGIQPSVIDEMDNANGNNQAAMDHAALMRDKAMWKNIADSMKDESEEMILRAAYKAHAASRQPENGNGDGTSDFSAYILSKKVSNSSKNVSKMSLPNTDHSGGLLQNTEGGQSGGVALSQRQFPTDSQTMPNQGNQFDLSRPTTSDRPSSTHGYTGGMGQPGGPTDLYANASSPYPHVPPNNQREEGKAEEKGNDFGTGGPPYIQAGGESAGAIPDHVPDMTYIGGRTTGGGFNTRGPGGLAHGQMKSLMVRCLPYARFDFSSV